MASICKCVDVVSRVMNREVKRQKLRMLLLLLLLMLLLMLLLGYVLMWLLVDGDEDGRVPYILRCLCVEDLMLGSHHLIWRALDNLDPTWIIVYLI